MTQLEECCSQGVRTSSKLTVLTVYKMIQKKSAQQFPLSMPQDQPECFLLRTSDNQRVPSALMRISSNDKQRCRTQAEASQSRNASGKKIFSISSKSTTEPPPDINRLIIEKLRRAVKKEQKKREKQPKLSDFGLNITQIKRLELPSRKDYAKQRSQLRVQKAEGSSTSKAQDVKSINYNKAIRSKVSHLRQKVDSVLKGAEKEQPLNKQIKFQSSIHHSFSGKIIRGKAAKESNIVLSKMQKMFDCWDIITNSFHCSIIPSLRETQPRANEKPQNNRYFYFIGNGNNANLIRSILRKRSWWCQTNNISKANLVWSQLKMGEVLQKVKKYQQTWGEAFVPYEEDWSTELEVEQLKKICKKSSSSELTRAPLTKRSSTGRIFHSSQSSKYHSVLDGKESLVRLERIAAPGVLHNHYSQNFMMGNKNALYYNLAMYHQFIKKDLGKVVPPTYYIEKGNQRSLEEFQKNFQDGKKKNNVWIVKPAQNSNRGQGIFVTSSLGDIRAALGQHQKLIVQSYIRNLLLYNGRKFDIRTYMLAVTIHGRLKVFWYNEGYIRTSSEPYDLSNLNDPFIHLTNDAIQKNGQNYGRYEEGNKLTYSQFERYLQLKFYHQNVHIYSMHEEMAAIAREAVRSVYCRLQAEKKQFSFQLFGLDFMIDSSFKPLLIEINTNPCLQLSSSGLERLIPRMIENIFRLCVDPIYRPNIEYSFTKSQSYYIYDESFLQRNKFSLLFDERYDRNFFWEERCRRMRGIQWGEGEQEQYENEGNIISIEY